MKLPAIIRAFARTLRVAVFPYLLLTSAASHASTWTDLWSTHEQQAQELLDAKQPAAAAPLFSDPRRRANAESAAGQYDQAAKSLAPFKDADSQYNRANALAHAGQLKDALAAYNSALASAPGDKDIIRNRDLVQRALEQQQNQAGQQQGKDGKNGSSGAKSGQSPGGSNEPGGQPQSGNQSSSSQSGSNQPGGQPQSGGQSSNGQSGSNAPQSGGQQPNSQPHANNPPGQSGSGSSSPPGGGQQPAQPGGSAQPANQPPGSQAHANNPPGQPGSNSSSPPGGGQQPAQSGGSAQPANQPPGSQAQAANQPPGSAQPANPPSGTPEGGLAPNQSSKGSDPSGALTAANAQQDANAALKYKQSQQARAAANSGPAPTTLTGPSGKTLSPADAPPAKPPTEQALALDQWLRGIPDDSGELLRRKFLIEHMMQQQQQRNAQ